MILMYILTSLESIYSIIYYKNLYVNIIIDYLMLLYNISKKRNALDTNA